MENPEEILHSLEEFSKMKPKDIPRELEEYLCFVAKTGNPVYQWPVIKSLFREKLINVITEFYESCPSMDIPPCPNVEMFNYDMMKNFILEKLDTFASAPFTVQRICELLTTPRKEYSRIDKYMRALEKNILVVSTVEPGRRSTENGEEGIMNGIETEHIPEISNERNDINIEDMDESPSWNVPVEYKDGEREAEDLLKNEVETTTESTPLFESEEIKPVPETPTSSSIEEAKVETQETVITCTSSEETIETYVSIEPQETYQNLSEESNSNSSDSSSSASASESKETIPEEKEANEEASELKEEVIKAVEENSQDVDKTEPTEAEPEPIPKEISEDTQFEIITSEPEKQLEPEKETETISAEQIVPDTSSPDLITATETVLEVEDKIETEEKEVENVEEKKEEEEITEEPIVPKIQSSEPEEPDNVVDSSTDVKTEEEESPEVISEPEKPETNDVTETVTNDIVETKEQYEESPMEVDSNQDKKSEVEEPSSSVESLID